MKRLLVIASLLVLCATSLSAAAEPAWVDLFNGRDLSHWVNVNGAPETWTVRDGVIHCTGVPTGAMRTDRQYENFILELDWRHLKPGGNSGVFVWGTALPAPGVPFLRGIEVQVLDNAFNIPGKNEWYTTHGDVFPIHGATMKPIHRGNGMRCFPSEERSKSSPEWNHYRIVGRDGKLRLSVNGKEVSGGDDCFYRKGYLALESEGSPVEFRNIRLQELPSSGATADQSAPVDEGWRPLYNGIDLRGWKAAAKGKWESRNWQLRSPAGAPPLFTQQPFREFDLIVDVKPESKGNRKEVAASIVLSLPKPRTGTYSEPLLVHDRVWTRNVVSVRHDGITLRTLFIPPEATKFSANPSLFEEGPIGLVGNKNGAVDFGNIFVRPVK